MVSTELRLIREFHSDTGAKVTAVRADAKARKIDEPEFPRGTHRMRVLLEKLGAP